MVVQQFLGLELLLTVGAFVITDLLVEVFHMVVQVLVLLVADVACGSLTQVNLFDVVLQRILGDKLLLAETALGDLVVTVLFEDVPAKVSNWEGLIAQLAFNFFTMVGQDVLVKVGNLTQFMFSKLEICKKDEKSVVHLLATDMATLFQLSLILLLPLSAGTPLTWLQVLSFQLGQNCRVIKVSG